MFVFTYLSAISFVIFFVLGSSVLVKNISNPKNVNLHFALLLIAVSIWCLGNYQADAALQNDALLVWSNIALIGGFLFSAFHVSFSYAFRGHSPLRRWYLFLFPSVLISFLLLLGIGGYTDPEIYYSSPASVLPGLFAYVYLPFNIISIIVTGYILLSKYSNLPAVKQSQVVVVFVGLAIMKIGGLFFSVILPLVGIYDYYAVAPLFSYFAMIAIAVSITRHQFLDIRLLVQRGIIYVILFTVLATVAVSLTTFIATFFTNTVIANLHIGVFISLFLGLWLLPIADARLRKLTNPWFFKDSYDYLESSNKLYTVLQNENTVSGISQKYIDQLQQILPHQQVFLVSFEQNIIFSADQYTTSDTQLINTVKSFVRSAPQELSPIAHSYSSHQHDVLGGIQAACPIVFNNNLVAALLFGAKKNGELHDPKDIQFITHLSQQLGVALQKAALLDAQTKQAEILEKEVQERTQQIKKIQESQEKTMLDISHALQTPLTVLSIESANLPHKIKQSINKTISHVSKSVKEILTLARLHNESPDSRDHEIIDLSALCELLSDYYCTNIKEKNIQAHYSIASECFISGNYVQIEEVINNIVENAIKYMPEQKIKTIKATLEKTAKHAIITITDNGMGIPKDEQDQLFSRFFRSSITKDIPGTGLGLAICKEIITQHSGTIQLDSDPSHTSFIITLPLAQLR